MADEKKQCDENWVDATPEHVFRVMKGDTVKARFRDTETDPWLFGNLKGAQVVHAEKYLWLTQGSSWKLCQVYCEPVPQESVEPVPTEKKHSGMDQASLWGAEPIEVRPIMQIRLPVAASVLCALSVGFTKHYPKSIMRQAGDYLIFEEPIEL